MRGERMPDDRAGACGEVTGVFGVLMMVGNVWVRKPASGRRLVEWLLLLSSTGDTDVGEVTIWGPGGVGVRVRLLVSQQNKQHRPPPALTLYEVHCGVVARGSAWRSLKDPLMAVRAWSWREAQAKPC